MNEWVEHNIVKDIKLNSFIHSFVLHNQATVQLPINLQALARPKALARGCEAYDYLAKLHPTKID